MATATPGPLINSIHGRIGNLVFYYRSGKQCVRIYVIPANPDTEAQRIVRFAFRDAVLSWQTMPVSRRNVFNRRARYLNMSGYNLYISGFMKAKISRIQAPHASSASDNNNLRAASFNPLTSVSKPYTGGYNENTDPGPSKPRPG